MFDGRAPEAGATLTWPRRSDPPLPSRHDAPGIVPRAFFVTVIRWTTRLLHSLQGSAGLTYRKGDVGMGGDTGDNRLFCIGFFRGRGPKFNVPCCSLTDLLHDASRAGFATDPIWGSANVNCGERRANESVNPDRCQFASSGSLGSEPMQNNPLSPVSAPIPTSPFRHVGPA
jgi:hypothetical protein